MTSTTKMATSTTEGGAFVPMSETQMETAKGGAGGFDYEAFHDYLVDLISDQASDPDSVVSAILSNLAPAPSVSESYWDDVAADASNEGFELPPWDMLDYF